MPRKAPPSLPRRFYASRLFLFIGIILLIGLCFGYVRAYYQGWKVRQEIASLQEQVQGLEKKKLASMQILSYVMSNDFVEEKARLELNMKKPGEHVIMLLGEKDKAQKNSGIEALAASGQARSNSVKWWYYFYHGVTP